MVMCAQLLHRKISILFFFAESVTLMKIHKAQTTLFVCHYSSPDQKDCNISLLNPFHRQHVTSIANTVNPSHSFVSLVEVLVFVFRRIYNAVVLNCMCDTKIQPLTSMKTNPSLHLLLKKKWNAVPRLSSAVQKECQTLPQVNSASPRMPCFARE